MSLTSQGPGWWRANDGKWYPPSAVSPDLPSPPKQTAANEAKGCLRGLLVVVVLIGVILGGFAIDHAITGQAKFTSHVDSYQPTDSSHLSIDIIVTNVGSKAGVPQCTVDAQSADYSDTGVAEFKNQFPMDPGQSGFVSGVVIITNNGAANITLVTAQC